MNHSRIHNRILYVHVCVDSQRVEKLPTAIDMDSGQWIQPSVLIGVHLERRRSRQFRCMLFTVYISNIRWKLKTGGAYGSRHFENFSSSWSLSTNIRCSSIPDAPLCWRMSATKQVPAFVIESDSQYGEDNGRLKAWMEFVAEDHEHFSENLTRGSSCHRNNKSYQVCRLMFY